MKYSYVVILICISSSACNSHHKVDPFKQYECNSSLIVKRFSIDSYKRQIDMQKDIIKSTQDIINLYKDSPEPYWTVEDGKVVTYNNELLAKEKKETQRHRRFKDNRKKGLRKAYSGQYSNE